MIPNTTPQRRLPLSDDTESNFAKNVSIFFPCASDLCPPEKEPYSCRFNRSNFFKRHLPLLPFEHIAHVTAVSTILFIYLLLLFYHSIHIYSFMQYLRKALLTLPLVIYRSSILVLSKLLRRCLVFKPRCI